MIKFMILCISQPSKSCPHLQKFPHSSLHIFMTKYFCHEYMKLFFKSKYICQDQHQAFYLNLKFENIFLNKKKSYYNQLIGLYEQYLPNYLGYRHRLTHNEEMKAPLKYKHNNRTGFY
jgi:hypothetical protein